MASSPGWNDLDKERFYTIGPVTLAAARGVLYPISLVKTRLQVQEGNSLYRGQLHAFRSIVQQEGFLALYKGFPVSLINVAVGQLYITTMEYLKSSYLPQHLESELARGFVAGATASFTSQILIVPLDIVSQHMMMEGIGQRGARRSALQVTRDIIAADGYRGLFRGYFISVGTYAPSSAVWWGSYSVYSEWLQRLKPGDSVAQETAATALSGALAGTTAGIATNPMDVVRARWQVLGEKHASLSAVVRDLFRAEGWFGLMKGVIPRISSMAPNSALVVTLYEFIKKSSTTEEYRRRVAEE